MARTLLRRLAVLFPLAALVVACSSSDQSSGDGGDAGADKRLGSIKVAIGAHVNSLWPVTVADAAGFFKEEGLDAEVVITNSGGNSLAAVAGGSAQFASFTWSDAIAATSKGQRLVAVSSLVNEYTTDAVISKKKYDELGLRPDLPLAERFAKAKGMKIGVNAPGSGQDKLVRLLLKRYGIDPEKDVQIVGLGNDGMLPSFVSGNVDAYLISSPVTDQGIAAGGQWWFRPSQGELPETAGMTYTALVAQPSYVKDHPEVTEAVVRALTKAQRMLKTDKAKSLEVLKGFSEADPKILESAYDGSVVSFPDNGVITEKQFQQNLDFMAALGQPISGVSYGDVVDNSFAEKASSG